MTPATFKQIGQTYAIAIAAAVALTGIAVMSLETAKAESAKEVVLEGRAAKTDRLDISNVKPEILRDQKSAPLPVPSTAKADPEPDEERGPCLIRPGRREGHHSERRSGERGRKAECGRHRTRCRYGGDAAQLRGPAGFQAALSDLQGKHRPLRTQGQLYLAADHRHQVTQQTSSPLPSDGLAAVV